MIKKSFTSAGSAKWIKRAQALASRISSRTGSKRNLIDGYLIEGKKVGSLKSARVTELPSNIIAQNHTAISSEKGIGKKGGYLITSRDALDPRAANAGLRLNSPNSLKLKHVIFGEAPDNSATNILSSGALTVTGKHERYHCSIMTNSSDKNFLVITSTPRKGEAVGWKYTFSEDVISALFPSLGFKYNTTDSEARYFQPLAVRVDREHEGELQRKLVILMPMTEFFDYVLPNNTPYSGTRYHLVSIELDIDSLTYSGNVLPVNDFLPDWAVPSDLKRPIAGHGFVEFPADSSIRLTAAMLGENNTVIASFNYFVRVQTYPDGEYSETEMELGRLEAAGRIVISGQSIQSLDLFDVDVYSWNGAGYWNFPLEPYIPREYTRPVISVGLTAKGEVITNGMTMSRYPKDVFTTPYLEPISPYSVIKIDGEEVAGYESGYGALRTKDIWPIRHIHYQGLIACSVSLAHLSDTTTAGTWYEPQTVREDSQVYGVAITDGERFRHIALGATTDSLVGQQVQLTCPQREVRSKDGDLICPSTIIACYWSSGKVFVSVRKGPVWPEDGAEADESVYWSDPNQLDIDDVAALYYQGNLYMTNNHGYYFVNRSSTSQEP